MTKNLKQALLEFELMCEKTGVVSGENYYCCTIKVTKCKRTFSESIEFLIYSEFPQPSIFDSNSAEGAFDKYQNSIAENAELKNQETFNSLVDEQSNLASDEDI